MPDAPAVMCQPRMAKATRLVPVRAETLRGAVSTAEKREYLRAGGTGRRLWREVLE